MFPAFSSSIAPSRVIRGESAWIKAQQLIPSICKRPVILGRSDTTDQIREILFEDLLNLKINPIKAKLEYDCCEKDLDKLLIINKAHYFDGVIAAGGGKVLDAGKLLAHRLNIPCITVPLSAATCAGWTALSNLYSPSGAFERDIALNCCPELLIFDHNFVRSAPKRMLASGIADALAKWYEASVSSSNSTDGLVQHAVQMARVLRDQLLIDADKAMNYPNSEEWIRVAEGCALTAGLIGGIGGPRCRTVAAHAVHNGLTQLNSCSNFLHGEKVGYGILVQLKLEETIAGNNLSGQARRQLLPFLRKLNLPVSLAGLGLEKAPLVDLNKACQFACKEDSDLHNLPFKVNSSDLLEALVGAGQDKKYTTKSKITVTSTKAH